MRIAEFGKISDFASAKRENKNSEIETLSEQRASALFPRVFLRRIPRNMAEWKNSRIFFMPHVDQVRHLYSCRVRDIFSKYSTRACSIVSSRASVSCRGY
jgi:hypothetical protein